MTENPRYKRGQDCVCHRTPEMNTLWICHIGAMVEYPFMVILGGLGAVAADT